MSDRRASESSLGLECMSPTEEVASPTSISPTSDYFYPSFRPAPSSGSSSSKRKPNKPPSLLHPPATIVSPPSPIEPKSEHRTAFSPPLTWTPPIQEWSTPPRTPTMEEDESQETPRNVDSGKEGRQESLSVGLDRRARAPSDELGPLPLAATNVSKSPTIMSPNRRDSLLPPDGAGSLPTSPQGSPRRRDSLLPPESPDPGGPCSAGPSSGATPLSPRSPAPSSPGHYPRFGHRRESSSHRVKESMGKQSSTEDGERMINQYRIGKSLGKGAFAKVESAVDVGTGVEYAIKEFSKSRLHTQALQEKHRQATRGRAMRGRGRGRGSPFPSGNKRERGESDEDQPGEDGERHDQGDKKGSGGPWGGTETVKEDPLGLIRREIAVMKKLDHPNIVHLYEAISVPSADSLFLVLEYLPGGVLMSIHLGQDPPEEPPFSVWQGREYFRQLVLGLEYLHHNGVIHRDIKPDNILLSEDRQVVKLCDFGVSEMFVAKADDRIKKSGGSPAFLSPESFTAHTHQVHGKAVDIWALGVTLYCILTGVLPFNTENPIELFERVQKEEVPIPDSWDADQADVIKEMLRKEPTFRITLPLLREHSWVTEHGDSPMITTDDNLYHVGKSVEEPTQEELSSAIGSLRGVFTVIRAVQKMRRLQLSRRSMSSSSTASPPPFSRTFTLDQDPDSAAVSMASGSMDSYVSDMQTENTSTEGGENRWDDVAGKDGERVGSPTPVEGETEDDGAAVGCGQRATDHGVKKPHGAVGGGGGNGRGEDGAEDKEKRLERLGADGFEGLKISTNLKSRTGESKSSQGSPTPKYRSPASGSLAPKSNQKDQPDSDQPPRDERKDQQDDVEITESPTGEAGDDGVVDISDSPIDLVGGEDEARQGDVQMSDSPVNVGGSGDSRLCAEKIKGKRPDLGKLKDSERVQNEEQVEICDSPTSA